VIYIVVVGGRNNNMANQVLGRCPVCEGELHVSELKCPKCGTIIKGDFILSDFDRLSEPQMKFAEVFLKNGGNIKLVEKDLNISYPTVKKMLEEVVAALGLSAATVPLQQEETKEEILASLKAGHIDFDEAEKRLARIGESIK
jgi:hypothetical protein